MGWLYLVAAAAIAGIMIWGKLEWYAAVLLGLIGPFVGMVIGLLLNFVCALLLPSWIVDNELFMALIMYGPAIAGSYFLAKSMRRKKLGTAS